jgi:hypothetical protein
MMAAGGGTMSKIGANVLFNMMDRDGNGRLDGNDSSLFSGAGYGHGQYGYGQSAYGYNNYRPYQPVASHYQNYPVTYAAPVYPVAPVQPAPYVAPAQPQIQKIFVETKIVKEKSESKKKTKERRSSADERDFELWKKFREFQKISDKYDDRSPSPEAKSKPRRTPR